MRGRGNNIGKLLLGTTIRRSEDCRDTLKPVLLIWYKLF